MEVAKGVKRKTEADYMMKDPDNASGFYILQELDDSCMYKESGTSSDIRYKQGQLQRRNEMCAKAMTKNVNTYEALTRKVDISVERWAADKRNEVEKVLKKLSNNTLKS